MSSVFLFGFSLLGEGKRRYVHRTFYFLFFTTIEDLRLEFDVSQKVEKVT